MSPIKADSSAALVPIHANANRLGLVLMTRSNLRIRRSKYFTVTNDQSYLAKYASVNSKFHDEDGVLLSEEDGEIDGVPLWSDHFSSINAIELKD